MSLAPQFVVGIALASLLLISCTCQVTEREQYSGFLSNYNNLEEVTTPTGEKAMRWVSRSWNPNASDTIAFRTLEFSPHRNPTNTSISRPWPTCRTTCRGRRKSCSARNTGGYRTWPPRRPAHIH